MFVPVPYRYDLTLLVPPATPEPEDGVVRIQPQIITTLDLQQALRTQSIGAQSVVSTATMVAEKKVDVVASTATQVAEICQLGSGFWELTLSLWAIASFTPALTFAASDISIQLNDPSGNVTDLIGSYLAANIPVGMTQKHRFLFVSSPWKLLIEIPATGVGQTISVVGSVSASKLL